MQWSFGDGTSANGTRVQHEFTAVGEWTVQAVAIDSKGRIGSDRIVIQLVPLAETTTETRTPLEFWTNLLVAALLVVLVTLQGLALARGRQRLTPSRDPASLGPKISEKRESEEKSGAEKADVLRRPESPGKNSEPAASPTGSDRPVENPAAEGEPKQTK